MKRFHGMNPTSLRVLTLLAFATLIPACGGGGNPPPPVLQFSITTGSLPGGVVGTAYPSTTIGTVSGTAPVTFAKLSGNLPPGLVMSGTGVITGTPTGTANFSTFTVRATDANSLTADRVLSITVTGGAPSGLAVTSPATLPGGTMNSFYSTGLSASGGTPGYTWAVTSGTLPAGLSLTGSTGVISGTPTAAGGPTTFTVRVTDSVAATATLSVSITINAALTATTPALPAWTTTSTTFSQTLTHNGGTTPFVWAVTGGTLPAGLALNSATGVISGTITVGAGTYNFTVQVTDAASASASQPLAIVVHDLPSITTATLPNWTKNLAGYTQTLAATGGTGPYTWAITAGAQPTGLNLSAGGVLSGTPTAAGPFTFTVRATDASSVAVTRAYTVTINDVILISPPILPNWTVNRPGYSQTLTATGGTGALVWSNGAGLPTGMAFSAAGVLSGTPTAGGPFTFTLTATDTLGATGSASYTVTINAAPSVTTTTLSAWTINHPGYSQTLARSGGTAPFTWSTSVLPPAGLSLNATTGVISGTPTGVTTSFTATVTDAAVATATSGTLTITINPAPSISTTTLPDGSSGVNYTSTLTATGGTGAHSWSLTLNPGWLSINSATGQLNGTPPAGGNVTFTANIVDTVGASASAALSFFVLAPLQVTTTSPLPGAVVGGPAYSQQLTGTGGRPSGGPYTWSLLSGSLPPGLGPLTTGGVISGSATTNGTYNFIVRATDSDGRTADKALSISVTGGAPSPLTIVGAPPAGTLGQAYSGGVNASGGTPPYGPWSTTLVVPGLAFSNGVWAGTPTATGSFTGTVTVTDSTTPAAQTKISGTLTLVINPVLSTVAPATLPAWTVNRIYSQTLTVTGGTAPYTWAKISGGLPPGMTFSTGGVLGGTPTGGSGSFTVQAMDSAGATRSASYTITINSAPVVTTVSPLPAGTQSSPYSATLGANNGTPPYSWTQTGGTLPGGLSLSLGGVLSGTPAASGDFTLIAQVADGANATASSGTLNLHINSPISITTLTLPNSTIGLAYDQAIATNGGTGAVTWSRVSGLPTNGLDLNTSNGHITGTPTAPAGPITFTVRATDSLGSQANQTYTIQVQSGPAVATVVPASIAPLVNLTTNLVITFNMPMVKSEVQANFSLSPLTGAPVHSFFWDVAGLNGTIMTVVFDTVAPVGIITADDLLTENTVYTWTIAGGAHSASALVMPAQTGQFKTIFDGTPPSLVSITPDPRTAVLSNVTGFTVVFSENMDTGTTNGRTQVQVDGGADQRSASAGTTTGPLTVQWTNATTLAIGFNPALTANTGYRLQMQQLSDASGNGLRLPDINVVTAGAKTGAPFITVTYPVAGSVGVNRDTGIFISLSEPLSPNLTTQLSITGATTPYQIYYSLGKQNGPLGVQIAPKAAWPASTTITVTIPVTVTNASGIPLAAPFTFSFTTGTTASGTNAIVIDDPFSTLKNAMTDCNSFSGATGDLFFKDSVTGNRVYLDDSTLNNSSISVTDPNGIPVKNFVVNASNGGGSHEVGRKLQFGTRNSQGIGGLALGTTYTISFKGTIKGSAGQAFAPTSYTFTTVSGPSVLTRAQPDFNDTRAGTSAGPPNPTRTLDARMNLNRNGSGVQVSSVAAAVGGSTNYTSNGGFLPGWITAGANVTVSGCSNAANNGTFGVTAVTGSGPFTITLSNAAGVLEATPPGSAQIGPPYAVSIADVTGAGNTFAANLTLSNFSYQYSSPGNETTLVTSGTHKFRYTVADGVPAHTLLVDETSFFFTGPDMTALTLSPVSPPGGATPTYSWSGTAPASVTALFVSVSDTVSGNQLYSWVIPPTQTSFVQPANNPLPAGNYSWSLGYFHSGDGTIRDNGAEGQLTPITFVR